MERSTALMKTPWTQIPKTTSLYQMICQDPKFPVNVLEVHSSSTGFASSTTFFVQVHNEQRGQGRGMARLHRHILIKPRSVLRPFNNLTPHSFLTLHSKYSACVRINRMLS